MELLHYELPDELEPFKEALQATLKPFIEIIPGEDKIQNPWQSCFGGTPYLPLDAQYPATPSGEPLFFLAQINFEEVPALAPFPTRGLLQFFIFDDSLYGMPSGEAGSDGAYRVVYYPEVIKDRSKLTSSFSFLRHFQQTPIDAGHGFPMLFEQLEEIAPITDHAFYDAMGQDFFKQFDEELRWAIVEEYATAVSAEGHKVGGYAHFAQEDPRSAEKPMVLLFQMDSDAEIECNWGDMGTAHFFINEEDLKKGDFSKVIFHWDCH